MIIFHRTLKHLLIGNPKGIDTVKVLTRQLRSAVPQSRNLFSEKSIYIWSYMTVSDRHHVGGHGIIYREDVDN